MLQDAEATEAANTGLAEEEVRRIAREEVERAFKRDPGLRRAAIIASKGTLDWAYPPLILATTAAAAGMDTSVFFTFYGLNIIHKDAASKLKVDPVGNPAMPMPMPIPDIVSALPGMVPLASKMLRSRFASHN
ncbi:MAG TPA: DsrE/DsrF/DrsH-like family protein, partial [Actinomycetes bacterium]|nr:DsrE/DsrF/DrsH-like family protein [Actinomycetes bacterium]